VGLGRKVLVAALGLITLLVTACTSSSNSNVVQQKSPRQAKNQLFTNPGAEATQALVGAMLTVEQGLAGTALRG